MFPLIFIVSVITLIFWKPKNGSMNDDEIYPNIGDIITIVTPASDSVFRGMMFQSRSQDIQNIFNSRGYQVVPISSSSESGILFQKWQVLGMAANIAVPRQLGNGMFIYSVRSN